MTESRRLDFGPAGRGLGTVDVETPALVVCEETLLGNIVRMQDLATSGGRRLRPHAKAHKSPEIASRQMAAGASGICCQTVAEVEAFARAGIVDILLTNQVADRPRVDRLAAVAATIRLGVCVDHSRQIELLATACRDRRSTIDVYIEVDVGGGRCGVRTAEEARMLARLVDGSNRLRLAGVQAYDGSAQHVEDPAERRERNRRARLRATDLDRAVRSSTSREPWALTGSGTGTCAFDAADGPYDELQPGSYCVMDADYLAALARPLHGESPALFSPALFVLTTVISVAPQSGVVVDAGLKAMSFDRHPPIVCRDPERIRYVDPSDEHGVLSVAPGAERPELGDRLLLVPPHCDPTIAQHRELLVERGGAIVDRWPVVARSG